MVKRVWISTNPNGWWRKHNPWKRDYIELQSKEESLAKAREIVEATRIELERQKIEGKIASHGYWRDPFPPRTY